MVFNVGTGLTEIDATSVRTFVLQTDELGSSSGVLDCQQTQLSNVTSVNGVVPQQTSNVAYGAAASVAGLSNQVYTVTQPLAESGFAKAVWTSNGLVGLSNYVIPIVLSTSNSLTGLSNLVLPIARGASNVAHAASNAFHQAFVGAGGATSNVRTTFWSSNLAANQLMSRGSQLFTAANKITYNDWIVGGPPFNPNDNTLAIAGMSLGAAGLATAVGGQLINPHGKLGASVLEDIGNKLGETALDEAYDPSGDGSNIGVHWNSLLYVPFHKNRGDGPIGFSNSLFLSSNSCKIFSVPATDLTLIDGGRYRRVRTNPTSNLLIDVGARAYFGNDLFMSSNVNSLNVTATSIFTSNVQASAVSVGTMVADKVKVGNLTLTADGLWIGDVDIDPFGSVLAVDAQGRYLGTIRSDQIVQTEALNFGRLGDGVLSLNRVGEEFVDAFGINDNPLFTF